MSAAKEEKLVEFLKSETRKTQKATKVFYGVGLFFAILVCGYMSFVLWMVKGFLEPDTMAVVVGNQMKESLPEVILSSEQALAENAPIYANDISLFFIRTVEKLGDEGKKEIDSAYQEQIPFISDEFSAMVAEYIDTHSYDLQEFAKSHSNEEFAHYFTEVMMGEMAAQLDTRIIETYGEGRNLKYFNDHLLYSLQSMDSTLGGMLQQNADEMNRYERLQRRILSRLVTSAHQAAEQ